MRVFQRSFSMPSWSMYRILRFIGVIAGAGVMNRFFTQPCPTPPGFPVARMYTLVPGPEARFLENM